MKLTTVASAITAVNGVFTVVAGAYWGQIFLPPYFCIAPVSNGVCPGPVSTNLALLALGVVLLVDSLVCFRGWVEGLYASAAISAIAVVDIAIGGIQLAPAFAIFAFLGLLTIALDILAARRKVFIPEEDHPLNLPVFG